MSVTSECNWRRSHGKVKLYVTCGTPYGDAIFYVEVEVQGHCSYVLSCFSCALWICDLIFYFKSTLIPHSLLAFHLYIFSFMFLLGLLINDLSLSLCFLFSFNFIHRRRYSTAGGRLGRCALLKVIRCAHLAVFIHAMSAADLRRLM